MASKTTTVKYVGSDPDGVEIDLNDGLEGVGPAWVMVPAGGEVEVRAEMAQNMLLQEENWQLPGGKRPRTSKPRVPKGPKSPASADEPPSEPDAGDQKD